MKKLIFLGTLLVLVAGLIIGWGTIGEVGAQITEYFYTDPDAGPFDSGLSKEEFMIKRNENIALLRGYDQENPPDPTLRMAAIEQLKQQETRRQEGSLSILGVGDPWTEIGPNPIPNGQVVAGTQLPVSGRTISIAVHPTNPDLVYVGTAQGGLYRSSNGGTTWTPLMDGALSLAIDTIEIAPSQPDTIFVGTGEAGFSADSFFGVGLYRIDNASSANPTIVGPIASSQFVGRSVSGIAVHPTDPNIIFVTSASGVGGIGGGGNSTLSARGVFRSTDALSAAPTFTKLTITGPAAQDRAFIDIVMDPGDPNLVLATLADSFSLAEGGVYRSTNALAATPTFVRTFTAGTGTSNSRTELALHRSGGGVVTVYAASGTSGGTVQRSIDGGATWTQQIDNNFCTPQCFYDIAIDVDPTNADTVYLGGSPTLAFGRSVNGGTTFTNNAATAGGLHADSHAIAVAPSQPSTIYFGSDGGIYRSTNGGTTWTSLNNSTFRATQFMSLAVHPTDPNFTIGGTQDNGTNFFRPDATWFRADFGDGGYAAIDQNATDTANVRMYHTYFNQTNAMGYARVTTSAGATEGNWTLFGCGFGGSTANGMTCTASAILFYAPLETGPGNPNTLYFGSDVLYRSSNGGTNVTKVSQEPIQSGVAISAIGIAPQNDNVRIVGQSNGNLFGTSTGSSTLVNLDAGNAVPNAFIARAAIDPSNADTAYVTLSRFGVSSIWKTTNLSNAAPTWQPADGTGANVVPQVPVSAFLIDPDDSNVLYAGTDIGVYVSNDGGTNWVPFGSGLPRVAVFDIAKTAGGLIRIATHGRGMWQITEFGNTPPTITAVPVTRQQDSSGSATIANVNDAEDAENTLAVTVVGPATVNGVTISGISVSAAGVVTANVAAACTATNASFTLQVTDSGSLSATATLNVTVTPETTPPVINPIANIVATLPPNTMATSMPVFYPAISASDNCSAPTITVSPPSGSIFPVGTSTVTVTATDAAGNTSTATFTVTVQYLFLGFTGRVSNPPATTFAIAGNMIPISFSLSGFKGYGIFAAGSPSSQRVNCMTGTPIGASSPASLPFGLIYMPDSYSVYWQTNAAWRGTCREFSVSLNDGSTRTINFRFYD